MSKPKFDRFDIVAIDADGTSKALVVKPPYKVSGKWKMLVNNRMYGKYDRFLWEDVEVNANDYVLIKRGIIGRMKYMNISKKSIALIVSLFALLIVSMSVANTYNAMVTGGNAVDNSWAKVETQEQRRYDLIDAMVQSVKGSQFQEQEVFSSIAQGRNAYKSASTTDEKVEAASSIATNIALLPRLQEAYPELKSNDQVTALMNELKSTENNILSARDSYNDTATNYNNYLTRFPKNVYANLFDFDKRSLFEASEESRKAPDFNFNDIRR